MTAHEEKRGARSVDAHDNGVRRLSDAMMTGCFGAREKGTCDNRLTVRRDDVEARVLKALEEKLLNQELFEEFCEEFTREMNRLRMQHRASLCGRRI